ncbi:MAG: hypothetical protein LBM56_01355 [Burkholderiaceae bacterium]|jgi:hypothetical protein|nr:hypothetical protein [Burkholderiaceae bacterium]
MIENLPIHVYIFAAILGFLALDFLIRFLLPAIRIRDELAHAIRLLKENAREPEKPIGAAFEKSNLLQALWLEYADSLHKQTENSPHTGLPETELRSTQPAGAFFRPEVIVDMPLRADFFRHLPGIFTGVGIIGTFSGLLTGLHAFQISENPIIVRDSLSHLLHGVSMAFIVSAAAITLAMGVTFVEKGILSHLHASVEQLAQLLDDFFSAGVGEEYLARLVKASEHTADQAAPMQSALLAELRQIMAEQTEKQISSFNLLGNRISWSIEASLKDPLTEMTEAVKRVSSEQGTAVHAMMHELLDNFNDNLRQLLGSQVADINQVQQQTLNALQETISRMESMAGNVESAGESAVHAMANQMAAAMTGAEARQQLINEKMGAFVEQLTQAVSQSQDAAQARLQHTLDDIANQMSAVIQGMSGHIVAAAEAGRQHQSDMAQENRKTVGEFGDQVDMLANGVTRAVEEMKMAVNAMRQVTGTTVSRLNAGADVLYAASTAFAETGRNMTETLGRTSGLVSQFSEAAVSISGISGELGRILADYQTARDTMTVFLDSLKNAVEQSRREATLNSEVLALIESATVKLVTAQKEADGYLARVSEVIENAHNTFTFGMVKAVDNANQEFQKALSDSVTLLRVGVQELGATLEELGTVRQSLTGNPWQNTGR